MYIKTLSIRSTIDGALLRPIIYFHKGVNFIVDKENSEKHNRVGKTTTLKLIDLILGAKNKKAIYTDIETGSENLELKNYIEKYKVEAALEIVDDLENPQIKHEISVDLFNGGKRKIDGEPIPQKSTGLYLELNKIFFNNNLNVPTFRDLIKSFVRISMSKDNDAFFKVNDGYSSTTEYRALYNYLFNISDPSRDEQRGKYEKELRKIGEAESKFKEINDTENIAELEQIINAQNGEILRLESQLNDVISKNEFEKNRDRISKVRKEYEAIVSQINEVEFQIDKTERAVRKAEKASVTRVDDQLAKDFFIEINSLIPTISKTYDDLINFNKKLIENKIKYFKTVRKRLDLRHSRLVSLKKDLIDNNINFISLIEEEKIDDYYKLTEEVSARRSDNSKKEETLSTLKKFENRKKELMELVTSLNTDDNDKSKEVYMQKMEKFNSYFLSVSEKINGEKPILVYDPNIKNFPISLKNLNNGTSTGTKKSLIAAYDISYQLFAQNENKSVPNFIVHDVLETVEGESLKAIVSQVMSTESQYIVAILKEKLDSSGFSEEDQEKMKVIELSETNRLFEGDI